MAELLSTPSHWPAPSIGRIVIVNTPDPINGQEESAAIVTQVFTNDMINVIIFGGDGKTHSFGSIFHRNSEEAKRQRAELLKMIGTDREHLMKVPATWRWPTRA